MLILFDILRVVDKAKLRAIYTENVAMFMWHRYGATQLVWRAAYQQILRDWDDYFADLNFSGDEGFTDFREGYFRITRALFRLVGLPELDTGALHKLSFDLLASASHGDVLTVEAKQAIKTARQQGFQLAVMTYLTADSAASILEASGVRDYFSHCIGFDTLERFERDAIFFRDLAHTIGISEDNQAIIVSEQLNVAIDLAHMIIYNGEVIDLPEFILSIVAK